MASQKKEKTETIRPGMFDAFEPPADKDALLSHIERLEELASALHTEESARDAAKEEKRAAARKEAAKKRAEVRERDAKGRARPRANRVPEPSPWDDNPALAYVVELADNDGIGGLPARLVMEDFEALHPLPERALVMGDHEKKPRPQKRKPRKQKVEVPESGNADTTMSLMDIAKTKKRGKYLRVEWARRFAWAVALSVDKIRREERIPSADEWSGIHEALIFGAALRAGHREIKEWGTALEIAEQQREEAPSKGARARWKNYAPHEKERELALAARCRSPHFAFWFHAAAAWGVTDFPNRAGRLRFHRVS